MSDKTGFYDAHGIPIHIGDLVRIKHYKHHRGRRQMWLYFRVHMIDGVAVLANWHDLDVSHHQCLLKHGGLTQSEVLAGAPWGYGTFNERKRKRRSLT